MHIDEMFTSGISLNGALCLCSDVIEHRTTLFFMGGGVAAHVYALVAAETLGPDAVSVTMCDRSHDVQDKTLCVWGEPNPVIRDAVVAEWGRLRFGYEGTSIVRDLDKIRYSQYTARSIRALTDSKVAVVRKTGEADLPDPACTVALDSRHTDQVRRPASISLLQHFHGWRVRTSAARFDPDVATMMDFRVSQSDGICFVYVLPYSPTEALVECTVFSADTWPQELYEERLKVYLRDVIGIVDYDVIATETGAIPMCDKQPVRQRGDAWIAIGVAGGLTKPTTGYTVARCIKDAYRLMQQYRLTGTFSPPPTAHWRFDWYDRLLLRIIRDEPAVVPHILWTLFERNPVERILRFLDEETRLREELLIFWSMPWRPFLRAIVRR